jgi:hypothetical protein
MMNKGFTSPYSKYERCLDVVDATSYEDIP